MSQRIHYLGHDSIKGYGISNNPKKVAWNVNSGAAAISLARHFGVRKIILVGFDMSIDNRRNSHWHGAHGMGSKNGKKWIPPFPRHLKGFEYIAKDAQELGIEIINASPDSAIKELPKVAVSELLKESNHETQEAENNILVGGSNQEQGTMAISGDLLNRGNCNQAMQE
jgi:hypothetical protein